MNRNSYWAKGHLYNGSNPVKNVVATMTYKLLMDFTSSHRNYRVGCYFEDSNRHQENTTSYHRTFYPLQKLIPSFDHFADIAQNEDKILDEAYVGYIFKDRKGPNHYNQLERTWKLKDSIDLEVVPKSIWGQMFGYDFSKATRIRIDPNAITELSVKSTDFFRIQVKSFYIEVWHNADISVSSSPHYFAFMSDQEQKSEHHTDICIDIRS